MSAAAKKKYEENLDTRYTEYIIDEENESVFLCLKKVRLISFSLAIAGSSVQLWFSSLFWLESLSFCFR